MSPIFFFDALTNANTTATVNQIVAAINADIQPQINGAKASVPVADIAIVVKAIVREVLRAVEYQPSSSLALIASDGVFQLAMDECFGGFEDDWNDAVEAIATEIVGPSGGFYGGEDEQQFMAACTATLRDAVRGAFDAATAAARGHYSNEFPFSEITEADLDAMWTTTERELEAA
jgi:hypothetical protein